VKEGQQVQKGQLLVQIDDALLVKEKEDLEGTLELATTVFERQEKLWKQNIGSEMQFLEAKNKKENLETKLKKVQTQLSKTRITAPYSGKIGLKNISLGPYVTPTNILTSISQVNDLKLEFTVPEKYS